ncbi:unnamed protein product [Schistocephalus solidus]|uniref:CUB domain-containing protein n=1 Tax=Schistocephalus solidus TaxID=70667 RepID=A0A183SD63_SCHSO|nr:unnamed protein product [Schistocephalus solidus]
MFRLPNHSQRNLAYAHTSSALKLNPEQSRYVQQPDMKIQLQVCLGPDCRSSGLKANLTDPRGQALMVGFSTSFTLFNIFCWSTLNLIATTPEEPEPVQRTIALHSAWTYTCDNKDILVTRGRVGEPIVLCLPTSKESKEALANETDFKRIFKEARCNCSTPGVTFSAGFLHLPSNASLSDSFPIQCQLRFLVRIVKEHISVFPNKTVYNPTEDELSLKICVWTVYRNTNLSLTLSDKNDGFLEEQVTANLTLKPFICHSLVNLVRRPIRGKTASLLTYNVTLSPMQTYGCDKQDLFITPEELVASKGRIWICLPEKNETSKPKGHVKPAEEGAFYEKQFNDVICNSTATGIRFARGFATYEEVDENPREYTLLNVDYTNVHGTSSLHRAFQV